MHLLYEHLLNVYVLASTDSRLAQCWFMDGKLRSMFSMMSMKSGTMTVMGLNNALSPSGSSERPK